MFVTTQASSNGERFIEDDVVEEDMTSEFFPMIFGEFEDRSSFCCLYSGHLPYICPIDSFQNPVIPADSGRFWGQIIPVEFNHSGIETGIFPGMHWNGMHLESGPWN